MQGEQLIDEQTILTVRVPVPVPEIKRFSRWQVFLALFDPTAHFTTCDTLRQQLAKETEVSTRHTIERLGIGKSINRGNGQ